MLLRVDESNSRPLYEQLADGVRAAIIAGDLRPGDRLPSGRDLADTSGVTLETVQRAYRRLADEGIVVARVGRGTTVATDLDVARLGLHDEIAGLIDAAHSLGMSLTEVRRLLDAAWR